MFRFGKAQAQQPVLHDDPSTSEARLRATETALHSVLEHTSDLVHLVDATGQLRYANKAWQQTLGGSGGPIDAFLAPSARAAYHEACRATLSTGERNTLTTAFYSQAGQQVEVRGQLTRHPGNAGEATVCGLFQNVTAREFRDERASHGATRDALTNLANRSYFTQHLPLALARARRQRTLVGVVYIDLDNFRDLNAQIGHPAGDQVLIAIGDRLKRCVRDEDLLARLDGDHFALVLERLHTIDDATFVIERILATIATPLLLPTDEEVLPEASIGVALSDDANADTRALLRAAEAAMERVKRVDGKSFAFAE